MPTDIDISPTARLIELMDHLGLARRISGRRSRGTSRDWRQTHPERLAGIVLCVPSRLDPAPFIDIADRVLMIAGERGPAAEGTARAAVRLPEAERIILPGYDAPGSWADAVADRTDEIADGMIAFLGQDGGARAPLRDAPIRPGGRRRRGHFLSRGGLGPGFGPAAVFPRAVAMGPGDPAACGAFHRRDARRPISGRCRFARRPGADADLSGDVPDADRHLAPRPGETIFEIGCGAGSLVRQLAQRVGKANPITAADVNPFLLREAAQLAEEDGLAGAIQFTHGNAEALPFEDGFL